VGAFVPVVVPLPAQLGYLLIALLVGAATACYVVGRRSLGSMVSQLAWGPSGRPPATARPPKGERKEARPKARGGRPRPRAHGVPPAPRGTSA
jgi:hypothetical protein